MKITLVSEGTYPYAMGGVSVWCEQLIKGMPDYRWDVVALTVDGAEQSVFPAPTNLDKVHSIPLWGARPPGRAPWRGPGGRPGASFTESYEVFVRALVTPMEATRSEQSAVSRSMFLLALRGMFEYASDGGDLSAALLSNQALTMLLDAWRDLRVDEIGPAPTVADAVEAAWLIEHMLRPLSAAPVKADIVHASMNGLATLVGMTSKWTHGTPLVMSEHGIYLRERYIANLHDEASHPVRVLVLSFFRSLAGAAYLITDVLAPHSMYNRRWQLHNGADPDRMWTMYNGVEPAEFPAATSEPALPTISYMGRIDPLKDLHTLIRAFALVRAEIPEARLRIFGGTPPVNRIYFESCERLIEELGLTGAAVMEGRVGNAVDAYHAGSIVALTSISEGFPYTVVEAMACGRPTVCTNVGGVAEAVGDTGVVVPPRDYAAVAEACVKLLRDNELRHRLGIMARARVLEHFTLRRSLKMYRNVYESLATPIRPATPPRHLRGQAQGRVTVPNQRVEAAQLQLDGEPEMSLDSGLESGLESGLDSDGNRRGSGRTAEATTHDTGPGEHTVLLPRISTDPLDDLVDRVRPMLGQAVDSLHVAAALEADGLTDRGARVEYGYHDVFALSTEVFRRLGPRLPMPRDAAAHDPRSFRESLRLISHGPLYVLPCTAFPAVLAIVGRRSLVLGLVFAGILGWVYAGVASHAAYRMLGFGRPRAAGRILIVATLTVPVVGAATGAGLVWLTGGGVALVAMITCQVAYQLTSTVMVFYRRELWLALVMTPAFLVGAAYLILGSGLRPWAAAVAAGCVLAAFALAVLVAVRRDRAAATAEPPLRVALRAEVPALFRVGAYGLCSAVLLLHAEAPYLLGSLDVAIAAAPLILTMGVIEWRAERFRPQVVTLLRRVERPRVFVRGVWRLLARETAICLLAPALPAAAMLAGLYYVGLLSAAGIVMTAAHVALGGAYLLAFLLAGRDRFGWLCWSMVAAILVHVGVGALLGSAPLLGLSGSALVDTSVYLGSVLLLQALFVLGLVPILGQAVHYR